MTKIDHNALPQPDRSWLRKMSANTRINNQIQMNHRKNHTIDQKTCPVPHSAATTIELLLHELLMQSCAGSPMTGITSSR